MNEVLQAIKERRSIRRFKAEQVKDEELNTVLEAGTWAPTGHGSQDPWIVAVQNSEQRATLSKANAEIMGTTSDPFYGAPTQVYVFASKDNENNVKDGSLVGHDDARRPFHRLGLMLDQPCGQDVRARRRESNDESVGPARRTGWRRLSGSRLSRCCSASRQATQGRVQQSHQVKSPSQKILSSKKQKAEISFLTYRNKKAHSVEWAFLCSPKTTVLLVV